MKTGRYRVRRGWLGKAILQEEHDEPTYFGGHVDASMRIKTWHDCRYKDIYHKTFTPSTPKGEE